MAALKACSFPPRQPAQGGIHAIPPLLGCLAHKSPTPAKPFWRTGAFPDQDSGEMTPIL
jgi:hypothetical protein